MLPVGHAGSTWAGVMRHAKGGWLDLPSLPRLQQTATRQLARHVGAWAYTQQVARARADSRHPLPARHDAVCAAAGDAVAMTETRRLPDDAGALPEAPRRQSVRATWAYCGPAYQQENAMDTTSRTQQAETPASPPSPAPVRRAQRRPGDLGQAVLARLASGQSGYCEIGKASVAGHPRCAGSWPHWFARAEMAKVPRAKACGMPSEGRRLSRR